MTGHVVAAFTKACVLTESRCSPIIFRKDVGQHLRIRPESISNIAKRFVVISKDIYVGTSKKSEIVKNLFQIFQRSKNVISFFYNNSTKSFLSSSAHVSKSEILKSEKNEEKVAMKKTEISFKDLRTFMKTGEMLLFDVREPNEVCQTGMLPSAINLPLSKLKCSFQMSEEDFKKEYKVQKPVPSASHMIVFYGLASVKGSSAVEIAHKLGYVKSRYYPGGYEEWKIKQAA